MFNPRVLNSRGLWWSPNLSPLVETPHCRQPRHRRRLVATPILFPILLSLDTSLPFSLSVIVLGGRAGCDDRLPAHRRPRFSLSLSFSLFWGFGGQDEEHSQAKVSPFCLYYARKKGPQPMLSIFFFGLSTHLTLLV